MPTTPEELLRRLEREASVERASIVSTENKSVLESPFLLIGGGLLVLLVLLLASGITFYFLIARQSAETQYDQGGYQQATELYRSLAETFPTRERAALSPQKVLGVPNPREDEEASSQQIEQHDEDPDVIRVFVDQYNTYLVIAPDGEHEVSSRLELINRLRDTQNFDPPPSKAMIIAHPEARHDKVVQALDAAVAAGLTKRLLSVSEKMFDD